MTLLMHQFVIEVQIVVLTKYKIFAIIIYGYHSEG